MKKLALGALALSICAMVAFQMCQQTDIYKRTIGKPFAYNVQVTEVEWDGAIVTRDTFAMGQGEHLDIDVTGDSNTVIIRIID